MTEYAAVCNKCKALYKCEIICDDRAEGWNKFVGSAYKYGFSQEVVGGITNWVCAECKPVNPKVKTVYIASEIDDKLENLKRAVSKTDAIICIFGGAFLVVVSIIALEIFDRLNEILGAVK